MNIKCSAVLALAILASCSPGKRAAEDSMTAGHATIGASDAIFSLAWKLSAAFQTNNPAAFVDIVRAPNLALVDSLLNERAEEIFLDRTLLPAETLAFKNARLKLYSYPVAYFPVYLLAAKDNPVQSIDSAELRGVLTGAIDNWKLLGGNDRHLTLYMPLPGEGAFQSLVGYYGGLDSVIAEPCSTSAAMLEKAKGDAGGLCVYPLALAEGSEWKRLSFERENFYIPANVETILESPTYPFMLSITYITTHNKADVAAGYLTFAMSNTGQREVMRLNYRPAAVPVRIVRMKRE